MKLSLFLHRKGQVGQWPGVAFYAPLSPPSEGGACPCLHVSATSDLQWGAETYAWLYSPYGGPTTSLQSMLFTVVGPVPTSPSSSSIRLLRASSRRLLRAQQAWTSVKIPTSAKLASFRCFLGSLGNERKGMPEGPRNQSTSVSLDVTGCAVLVCREPGDRLASQEKGHPALHGILA
uniref:Uncharacterized protein n=1 Tax=Myotis myotis TaxID=51298 RepID=A0A7J7U523_MYOMY|nr:hypothetical protein mMyoMyo1_008830 [Myotis myotis]